MPRLPSRFLDTLELANDDTIVHACNCIFSALDFNHFNDKFSIADASNFVDNVKIICKNSLVFKRVVVL